MEFGNSMFWGKLGETPIFLSYQFVYRLGVIEKSMLLVNMKNINSYIMWNVWENTNIPKLWIS